MEVEKLQMSPANCMDGTGRSGSIGGSQLDLNAKIMLAINRLNSSGDSGSPCLRPKVFEIWRPRHFISAMLPLTVVMRIIMTLGDTYVKLLSSKLQQILA